jgi:hypothetical protein
VGEAKRRRLRIGIVLPSDAAPMRAVTGNYEPADVNDPVSLPPAVTGHVGRAWLMDMAAQCRRLGIRPEDDGSVSTWMVEAPWAHFAWHSYAVILIHLRPMPDNRPTLFYLDGATHEVWVYALSAVEPREPAILGQAIPAFLQPKNFAAQFIAESDEAAAARVKAAVQEVVDGQLSPDAGCRHDWAARFGDNMLKDRQRG